MLAWHHPVCSMLVLHRPVCSMLMLHRPVCFMLVLHCPVCSVLVLQCAVCSILVLHHPVYSIPLLHCPVCSMLVLQCTVFCIILGIHSDVTFSCVVHAGLALSCELDSHENKTFLYYMCVFNVRIVVCFNFCNVVRRLIFDGCSQILQTLRSVASGVSLSAHLLMLCVPGCVGKCASNPCFNGGTCREGYSRYTCDCSYTPWRGWNCGRGAYLLRLFLPQVGAGATAPLSRVQQNACPGEVTPRWNTLLMRTHPHEKGWRGELYYTKIKILSSCLVLQSVSLIYMPIGRGRERECMTFCVFMCDRDWLR